MTPVGMPPDDGEEPLAEAAGRMLLRALQISAIGLALLDLLLFTYSK